MSIPRGIDLQFNGVATPSRIVDFSDPGLTRYAVLEAAEAARERGARGILATVITSPADSAGYASTLPILARAIRQQGDDPVILGIRLEGPCLNPRRRGAHPEAFLRMPSIELFDQLLMLAGGQVVMVDIAPELPGAFEAIEWLTRKGVVVSVAHHEAPLDDLKRAVQAGERAVTHFTNAMSKDLGSEELKWLLGNPDIVITTIFDGEHVSPETLRQIVDARRACKGPLAIVSDGSPCAGASLGTYRVFHGLECTVLPPGGRRLDPLTGSYYSQAEGAANARKWRLLSDREIEAAVWTT